MCTMFVFIGQDEENFPANAIDLEADNDGLDVREKISQSARRSRRYIL